MRYLTGILALGIPCELKTAGKWNVFRADFMDPEKFKLVESDESVFGDYGIEENKLVPGREYATWSVANHVRAYVDMVEQLMFDELEDVFYECIQDGKARQDIFMLVYGKLRNTAHFHEINVFMECEFGNAWYSYIQSVNAVAEKLAEKAEKVANGENIIPDVPLASDMVPSYIRKALNQDEEVAKQLAPKV